MMCTGSRLHAFMRFREWILSMTRNRSNLTFVYILTEVVPVEGMTSGTILVSRIRTYDAKDAGQEQ